MWLVGKPFFFPFSVLAPTGQISYRQPLDHDQLVEPWHEDAHMCSELTPEPLLAGSVYAHVTR